MLRRLLLGTHGRARGGGRDGLIWVIAIALVVAAERLLPVGHRVGRVGGTALVAAGPAVTL